MKPEENSVGFASLCEELSATDFFSATTYGHATPPLCRSKDKESTR